MQFVVVAIVVAGISVVVGGVVIVLAATAVVVKDQAGPGSPLFSRTPSNITYMSSQAFAVTIQHSQFIWSQRKTEVPDIIQCHSNR